MCYKHYVYKKHVLRTKIPPLLMSTHCRILLGCINITQTMLSMFIDLKRCNIGLVCLIAFDTLPLIFANPRNRKPFMLLYFCDLYCTNLLPLIFVQKFGKV